jgi:hypothetical protein
MFFRKLATKQSGRFFFCCIAETKEISAQHFFYKKKSWAMAFVRDTPSLLNVAAPLETLAYFFRESFEESRWVRTEDVIMVIQETFVALATPPLHPAVAKMTAEDFEAFRDAVWAAYLDDVRPWFVKRDVFQAREVFEVIRRSLDATSSRSENEGERATSSRSEGGTLQEETKRMKLYR